MNEKDGGGILRTANRQESSPSGVLLALHSYKQGFMYNIDKHFFSLHRLYLVGYSIIIE